MRIIGGSAGGHRLKSPRTTRVRPASDKVKEAVFAILGNIEGLTVLDLFAGSGSIGLEAASRGAKFVVFIDSWASSIKLIKENACLTGLSPVIRLIKGRLPQAIRKIPSSVCPFDLVFIDPPYDRGLVGITLKALKTDKVIDPQSLIIIEHSPREGADSEGYDVVKSRSYGQTQITFLKKRIERDET